MPVDNETCLFYFTGQIGLLSTLYMECVFAQYPLYSGGKSTVNMSRNKGVSCCIF